tara:strand:+ start:447 stop:605 length:159 start_codon:yes stop_codon:yes gene_type:complete
MSDKITPYFVNKTLETKLINLAVKNKAIADILIDYSPRNKSVIEKARKKQKK